MLNYNPIIALQKYSKSLPENKCNISSPIVSIPTFYKKKVTLIEPASRLLQEYINDMKRATILTDSDLDNLWELLAKLNPENSNEDSMKMSFMQFVSLKESLPEKFHAYIKASIFALFTRDRNGRIACLAYFNYVLRRLSLLEATFEISAYDLDHDGFININELSRYISQTMKDLNLNEMTDDFKQYYMCSAIKKFQFFLDPLNKGKISVFSITISPILSDFLQLGDFEIPKEIRNRNWFSMHSTRKIYEDFLALDKDLDGKLSPAELKNFNGGCISSLFIDCVFSERRMFNGKMDYNSYIEFVLALDNLHTKESITYCFKMLDWKHENVLFESTISEFLKNISKKMEFFGIEQFIEEDVINEVFDMANPKSCDRIDLDDLIKCGNGGTIMSILIDCKGFITYETRSSTPHEN